jgi:hypothetical protein
MLNKFEDDIKIKKIPCDFTKLNFLKYDEEYREKIKLDQTKYILYVHKIL